MDSDDAQLTYTLTQDPPHGQLLLVMAGKEVTLSKSGPLKTFTQMQINNGKIIVFILITFFLSKPGHFFLRKHFKSQIWAGLFKTNHIVN